MTVKDFRQSCAASVDFTFYDEHADVVDWVSFDRNDDPEKLERANQKIEKYYNFTVAAFTTFNDIIRVHVVLKGGTNGKI